MQDTNTYKDYLFFPVSLKTMRIDTPLPFDVYLRIKNDKMVLFLSHGNVFNEDARQRLMENKVSWLYIKNAHKRQFNHYLHQHLEEIIGDSTISIEQKTSIAHETISSLAEELFDKPETQTIHQYKSAISSTVKLVFDNEDAMNNLIRITSYDFTTYTHSINVGIFALGLAKEILGSDAEYNIDALAAGFFLHDIGKCLVPHSVLNKPGPLNPSEWKVMKRHPYNGYKILHQFDELSPEAEVIVMQHHERHNGNGYPNGLKGDDIHVYSKICCIADVFDALTSQRPYKRPKSTFEALEIMREEMAGEFDPEFFSRFVLLFSEHDYKPKSASASNHFEFSLTGT